MNIDEPDDLNLLDEVHESKQHSKAGDPDVETIEVVGTIDRTSEVDKTSKD